MRSEDVPQDATPPRIRAAVQAIRDRAPNPAVVAERTGLSERHVHYHLRAARTLGFVERSHGWYVVSPRGLEWLDTPEGSAADRATFTKAMAASEVLRSVAPDLLADASPSIDRTAERVRLLTDMSPETAQRRAETLIRWRRYALAQDPPDLFGPSTLATGPLVAPRLATQDEPGRPVRRIQVRQFGCLADVSAPIGNFTVVVGANATGKTTFFDVMGFIADALRTDVTQALLERVNSLDEILTFGEGDSFAFAIDLSIPAALKPNGLQVARYELEVGRGASGADAQVLAEALFLKDGEVPGEMTHPDRTPAGWRKVLSLNRAGSAWYRSEKTDWKSIFQLGSKKLALSQLPEDRSRFPVALWAKSVLGVGVQRLELNGRAMRRPTSPLLSGGFLPDGSNLPIVVRRLRSEDPPRFREWVSHVALALPDISDVRVVEREEDKHAYLKVVYKGGLELPAWRVSDGTLRLLGLTLLAFVDEPDAVYLIEEPENGIHPRALEVVYQALANCYESQVLVATHSPVFLSVVPPEKFLVLAKAGGRTSITAGRDHPLLRDWRRQADLGTLFASGVLT